MVMGDERRTILCLSLILLAAALHPAHGQTTERISCFLIGDSVTAPWNPFASLFVQDPLFTYGLYPLGHVSEDEKRKLDRVYYPRTGEMLARAYDFMVFRDARVTHFTPRQFSELEHVFREEKMGSVAVHSLSWDVAWLPTVLYDLSPISDYQFRFSVPWGVRLRREREDVFLPFADLGIERAIGMEYGIMTVKQGATVWGDMWPQDLPWLVSWEPDGGNPGMKWVFADKFDSSWWGTAPGSRGSNPYAIDLATNLILHSLDRPLVTDVLARREARDLFSALRSRKILILSMLSWAESFGANIFSLSERLSQIEEESVDAVEDYLEQDYGSAISFLESLGPTVYDISEQARRLKDQALFWVYVSEWLAVTSAAMLSGFALWTLMIKRRMYRAVGETRLRRA
jgi:hypothetical protein